MLSISGGLEEGKNSFDITNGPDKEIDYYAVLSKFGEYTAATSLESISYQYVSKARPANERSSKTYLDFGISRIHRILYYVAGISRFDKLSKIE